MHLRNRQLPAPASRPSRPPRNNLASQAAANLFNAGSNNAGSNPLSAAAAAAIGGPPPIYQGPHANILNALAQQFQQQSQRAQQAQQPGPGESNVIWRTNPRTRRVKFIKQATIDARHRSIPEYRTLTSGRYARARERAGRAQRDIDRFGIVGTRVRPPDLKNKAGRIYDRKPNSAVESGVIHPALSGPPDVYQRGPNQGNPKPKKRLWHRIAKTESGVDAVVDWNGAKYAQLYRGKGLCRH